ncbi:uncharacterized protein LOC131695232 [Topomyia yanbarensis]|uniref:uncharacterized protein LOC131695232 n=1 Tax=Topomyia yanbarensis TaxID=2498891 RepID=UPI00273C0116|nr:uncharacterized protein LOC131695232 [Topomyia yanbarensis]
MTTNEEIRPHLLVHGMIQPPVVPVHRFSSWKRVVHVTAYVIRYVKNLGQTVKCHPRSFGPLTHTEIKAGENQLLRQAQQLAYPDELALLSFKTDAQLPKSSQLYRLSPIKDENNVIRVRGRIDACEFATNDMKQPIILPRNHPVTILILTYYHTLYCHINHETALNEIRQRFYTPRLRASYKKVRRNCQWCKNQRAISIPPEMGSLPPARLAAHAKPFSFSGIDYFGPMMVAVGRRSEKRWGVLVTCLTTRAIHIEIVHSLTTDSCIMALKNFMARRGIPKEFFSDNATNFHGANNELKAVSEHINQDRMAAEFTSSETKWTFIPPGSPHMGGAWERLVQSVKRNLAQLKLSRLPSDEVFRNALTLIENTVNSRPLTYIPLDDEIATVLTPNHFLIGSSNGLKPDVLFDDSGVALKRAWHMSQIIANQFWKIWIRDYLPTLTRRTKWFEKSKPLTVGDIVIVIDPKLPRNCWPKGRIIATTTGKDGHVRSAAVQTGSGIYERPTLNLAVLDVERE